MSGANSSRRGLGRGFEALISGDVDRIISGQQIGDRIKNVFTSDVFPNPDQPRKEFDKGQIKELSDSIKRFGILQPLIVARLDKSDGYVIIAGERRWRAAKQAGLKEVPVIIRSAKEVEQLEISIVENIQRVDLSPLEQASSIGKLHDVFGVSYEDIAKRLNKAESTVNNIVRLLKLPEAAKEALRSGKITEGHARTILSLSGNKSKQGDLLSLILTRGWSVRQAEQFVVSTKNEHNLEKAKKSTQDSNKYTERLSKILKYPVTVTNMAKGGKLVIRFKDDSELRDIIDTIENRQKGNK